MGRGPRRPRRANLKTRRPMSDELCWMTAADLARAIAKKTVSPVDVLDAVLARIEKLSALNAYVTLDGGARKAARAAESALTRRSAKLGPLHGVPFSVKDLVNTRGVRTTFGTPLYRDNVPTEDAPVVERLEAAGGIMVGKTNTPTLGWVGITDNLVFGLTRNPWNLDRTPGGSSGGAGAAVAAGLAPLALGTDGAGSIRIPSSFCGIFGLKPSFGRVPFYPSPGASELSAALGPMTRTVADAALLLDVIAGPDDRDRFSLPAPPGSFVAELAKDVRGLRVAWSPDLGHIPVEPEIVRVAEHAARAFANLGCTVEAPALGLPDPAPILEVLYASIQAGSHGRRPPEQLAEIDPGLVALIDVGRRYSAVDVGQMMIARAAYWNAMRQVFERHDLLFTSMIAGPP